MGLIKEPLHIDFYVEPRSLTKTERGLISQHIIAYKAKMAKRVVRKTTDKQKKLAKV